MNKKTISAEQLRSRQWFDNPSDPSMTALYLERYLNFGLTRGELQARRPIIGIAQSGSDLTPCNRLHVTLAERVKEGIRDAGGVPIEFPIHPIQETGRRPTAALDRNLQAIGLIEILHGYPLDGVVLTTGCDKTTPAQLMAAASVDLPAIALSVGPMLNGSYKGACVGAGATIWQARQLYAAKKIDYEGFMQMAACSAPSAGHCNTMGTALTMNSLTEAMGMMLPGGASIPAPYRERQQHAYRSGQRIVDMVWEDLKPSDIITRAAIANAIVVCAAIGGSTNAPIHIAAIAAHAGVDIDISDWNKLGGAIPQIVNCQPVGDYLAEEYHRAGGVPAVLFALKQAGLLNADSRTVSGATIGEDCENCHPIDAKVIRACSDPVRDKAGLMILSSNFFSSAVLKAAAITEEFRDRYLSDPQSPNIFEVTCAVFEGPEDYHQRIDDPSLAIDENTILVVRGAGPKGYPGSAEVVNMQPPARLIKAGICELPTMGDGRQSGTSGAPSILHVTPEAADGGDLAILQTGDRLRIDLNRCYVELLLSPEEIAARREVLNFAAPAPQTWWQAIFQQSVSSLERGGVFEDMVTYRNIKANPPRHSH